MLGHWHLSGGISLGDVRIARFSTGDGIGFGVIEGALGEEVVATIDVPTSHHGADWPDVKNSAVLDPARLR